MKASALGLLDRFSDEVEVLTDEVALETLVSLVYPSESGISALPPEGLKKLQESGFIISTDGLPTVTERAREFLVLFSSAARASNTKRNITIISRDSLFKGELTFDDELEIFGGFEGRISTSGKVRIMSGGRVNADIEAGSIVIEGEVHGNLSASGQIHLGPSARYEGDLRASKLKADDGAIMIGHASIGPDAIKGRNPAMFSVSVSRSTQVGGPATTLPTANVYR